MLHPDVQIGKNVIIEKGANIKCIWGGKISIGDNVHIRKGAIIWTYGNDIVIGNDCTINPYCIIYGQGSTKIGDNVLIAANSVIVPSNHNFSDVTSSIREQKTTDKGIEIKDNVWIANGCTILDGVTINSGSVIAAGAVVNKDVEEFTVVGGVPAKVIKRLKE